MPMNVRNHEAVEELPPSAGFVVWFLEQQGGSALRQELLDETILEERTLDRAVDRLEELDIVRRDRSGSDLRYVRITLP